jgi:hypothetical protein
VRAILFGNNSTAKQWVGILRHGWWSVCGTPRSEATLFLLVFQRSLSVRPWPPALFALAQII